jgi:hypothetical protein
MRQPMIPSMTRLSCGTIRCQINGRYVPFAEFSLAAGDWIYFSPHVLAWTDPAATLTVPRSSLGRSPGLIEAHGPGHLGVAENRPGEVIALPLRPGQLACVRPGRFLCATGNVGYQWEPSAVCYTTMMAEREYPMGGYREFAYVPGQHVRRAAWRSSRIWLRVYGPGRVVIDSAREQHDGANTPDYQSFASWQRWDAPSTTTTSAEETST